MNGMNAECRREIKQLLQINSQRAAFNFGNGAARGVVPAGKLQLVGQINLRPVPPVAQSGDVPSDEISFLHHEQNVAGVCSRISGVRLL